MLEAFDGERGAVRQGNDVVGRKVRSWVDAMISGWSCRSTSGEESLKTTERGARTGSARSVGRGGRSRKRELGRLRTGSRSRRSTLKRKGKGRGVCSSRRRKTLANRYGDGVGMRIEENNFNKPTYHTLGKVEVEA